MKLSKFINNIKIGQRLAFSYAIIFIFFVANGALFITSNKLTDQFGEQEIIIQLVITKVRDASRIKSDFIVSPSENKKKSVAGQYAYAEKKLNLLTESIGESLPIIDTSLMYLDTMTVSKDLFFNNRTEYDSLLNICINQTERIREAIFDNVRVPKELSELLRNQEDNYLKYKLVPAKFSENNQVKVIEKMLETISNTNDYNIDKKTNIEQLVSELQNINAQFISAANINRTTMKQWDTSSKEIVKALRVAETQINEHNTAQLNKLLITGIAITVIVVLIMAVLALLITNSITNGINETVKVARLISSGKLNVRINKDYLERKDQIGALTVAFQNMNDKLSESITDIVTGVNYLTSLSENLNTQSHSLSEGASNQAASVEEIGSTVEQLVANIDQNASNSGKTQKMASVAFESIRQISTDTAMAVQKSEEINSNVKVVSGIAMQTNILALNAAVEAARAGDAGRGFSVVATEVRKLAEKSKEAADIIINLSHEGFELSQKSGENLQSTMPEIEQTGQLIDEISVASQEQKVGTIQINTALNSLNTLTQKNASQAIHIADSANELKEEAQKMNEAISMFQLNEEA